MPAVMLLGPTRWDAAAHAVDPAKASALQSRDLLEVRKDLARRLEGEVVLMEDEGRAEGEAFMAKFLRLVADRGVERFVVLWPRGAMLNGLDVELGCLLARVVEGRLPPEAVVVLAEEGLGLEGDPGNATDYHLDLRQLGCRLEDWRSLEDLHDLVPSLGGAARTLASRG